MDERDGVKVPQSDLPPSPPITESSTKSSPASSLPFVSPRETPPYSPGSRSNHSSSPSAATSPLPPLPTEVFLNVLSFLDQNDIERLLGVSRAWCSYLTSEPSLWTTVTTDLSVDDLWRVQRICRFSDINRKRSSGGIRHLDIRLACQKGPRLMYDDTVSHEEATSKLDAVLDAVFRASVLTNALDHPPGGPRPALSTVKTFALKLYPNTSTPAYVLHALSQWTGSALFDDLERFSLFASMPELLVAGHFLYLFPNLVELSIAVPSVGAHMRAVHLNRWLWQPRQPLRVSPRGLRRLRSIFLSGVRIAELELPPLPALETLGLDQLEWEGKGVYHLIRLARRTLRTIECHDVRLTEARDVGDDFATQVDIREPHLVDGHLFDESDEEMAFSEPAPIILPSLTSLVLDGATWPLFANLEPFEVEADDAEPWPTPILVMPNLISARLDDTPVDTTESFLDDYHAPLAVLGRSAPDVQELSLRSLLTCDESVLSCLAAMNARIVSLDLSGSGITDALVVQLPNLTPNLHYLDVRNCADVSSQGVARAVEVIRDRHDEGDTKVVGVWVDRPSSNADPACWRARAWLDFVGVLLRDERDFEGDGPQDPKKRRQWIVEGKRDQQWQYKIAWEEKERQEREAAAKARAHAEAYLLRGGGGSGASGHHRIDLSPLSQIAAVQQASKHYQQPHSVLAAQPFPPPASLAFPSMSLAPSHPQVYPSVAMPAPTPLPPPGFIPPAPAPVVNHVQQQQPPQQAERKQSSASDALDLSQIDSMAFEQLDPDLIREQELALEQAKERNQAHLNAMLAHQIEAEEQEARAAAIERQQQQQAQPPSELHFLNGLRASHAPPPPSRESSGGTAMPTTASTPRTMTPVETPQMAPLPRQVYKSASDPVLPFSMSNPSLRPQAPAPMEGTQQAPVSQAVLDAQGGFATASDSDDEDGLEPVQVD
ncbi:hypothetical protein JCM10207_004360 [Rhodosporidiobolus poonsookiae]